MLYNILFDKMIRFFFFNFHLVVL